MSQVFENKFKSKILLHKLLDYLLKSSYLCNVNERGSVPATYSLYLAFIVTPLNKK